MNNINLPYCEFCKRYVGGSSHWSIEEHRAGACKPHDKNVTQDILSNIKYKKESTMSDTDFRIMYKPVIEMILTAYDAHKTLTMPQGRSATPTHEVVMNMAVESRKQLREKLITDLKLTPEQKELLNLLYLVDKKVLVEKVSAEVQGETTMESVYSMQESVEWENQELEAIESEESSVLTARKATVVWVQEPRSSTRVFRENLARLAARFPGYWESEGLREKESKE